MNSELLGPGLSLSPDWHTTHHDATVKEVETKQAQAQMGSVLAIWHKELPMSYVGKIPDGAVGLFCTYTRMTFHVPFRFAALATFSLNDRWG